MYVALILAATFYYTNMNKKSLGLRLVFALLPSIRPIPQYVGLNSLQADFMPLLCLSSNSKIYSEVAYLLDKTALILAMTSNYSIIALLKYQHQFILKEVVLAFVTHFILGWSH